MCPFVLHSLFYISHFLSMCLLCQCISSVSLSPYSTSIPILHRCILASFSLSPSLSLFLRLWMRNWIFSESAACHPQMLSIWYFFSHYQRSVKEAENETGNEMLWVGKWPWMPIIWHYINYMTLIINGQWSMVKGQSLFIYYPLLCSI